MAKASRKDLLNEVRELSAEIAAIKAAPASTDENEAALSAFFDDIRESEERIFDLAADVLRGTANPADFEQSPHLLKHAFRLAVGGMGVDRILAEARQRAASAIEGRGKPLSRVERHDRLQSALTSRYRAALELVGELGEVDPQVAAELPAGALLGIPTDEAADGGVLDV